MLTCIGADASSIPREARRDRRCLDSRWPHRGTARKSARADDVYDATGMIVMAGAIDIHSHIAGANVNTARLLLPEQHRGAALGGATPLRPRAGRHIRPAATTPRWVSPPSSSRRSRRTALHAHLELADVPIIDKAILCVLGNDDYLLRLMRDGASAAHVSEYVAWTLQATRALGVKVINAGAAAAFKANVRSFSLDDVVPWYGVSSRDIVKTLQRAVIDLGLPHPLHVHCNNLGLAAGADSVIATIEAAEGLPLHLAHIQFYAYGAEGEKRFSSAAPRLAECVNLTRTSPSTWVRSCLGRP